jgi:DnaK suppressor protein
MATRQIKRTPADLSRRKTALESRLQELLRASGERDELRIEYLADPIDQISSRTDREVIVQRLDSVTRLVHDVQSALSRIREGSYGFCENCESEIQRNRLDAIPWARLCIRCQSRAETVGGDGGLTLRHAA